MKRQCDSRLVVQAASDLPLTERELRKQTVRSSLLSRVIAYVDRGWPRDRSLVPSELLTFYEKRDSVSYKDWHSNVARKDYCS